jgi:hypothetical protein
MMEQCMKRTSAGSTLLTILLLWIHRRIPGSIPPALPITAATVAYHFLMRLCVGEVLNRTLRNREDYTRPWFRVGDREMVLYKRLRVRK